VSDYTPTTEDIRAGWEYATAVIGDEGTAQFDRWLAEVKAKEREDCVNHVKFLYCSHSMEYRPYQEAVDDIVEVLTGKEDGSDVFDKWLAEVKAQVWEEAYMTGVSDVIADKGATMSPYRQGETE